jgi:NADPH-dependent 2,4-dienoyl-CoA reductase/sulfur reductase-like enzyme
LGNAPLEENGVEVKVEEVEQIDRQAKKIKIKNDTLEYGKLILATGSNPIMPPIEGIEKKGIFPIKKEMDYLKNLKNEILGSKNIVVVGGGFIGVEFADELSKFKGKNISIVEMLPEVLANSFDSQFSELARQQLAGKKVNIFTDSKVERFNGHDRIESVSISGGKQIPADLVVLGIGATPNSALAKESGLEIGKSGGIIVDEYLRTSEPDIFAVGDCAEKKDFFTRKKINVMLASTATAEARVAGANLFKLKVVRENKGTIATYSTQVGDLVLGSAGLTEKTAMNEGFEIIVGNAQTIDRHPGKQKGASKVKVKLVFSKQSGILLGGQVAGGISAGEITNIIGLALQKNVLLTELGTLQIATHPKLTAAPTTYPIIAAAQDALTQCDICKA